MKHDLSDLDQLARHWPILFGRALDPSSMLGVQGLLLSRSGRTDATDARSPEIQRALRALDRLYDMHQEEITRQAAEILLYARVACGEVARLAGAVYLKIALGYHTAPKRMTQSKQRALIERGKRLYDGACAKYGKVMP